MNTVKAVDMAIQVGIDEAGRGCVIGPMIIAAVATDDPLRLSLLNLKDSKVLSPSRRKTLSKEIKKNAYVKLVKISARKLTELMNKMSLNKIELLYMAKLINQFISDGYNIKKVYIDCPENNTEKFKELIKQKLTKKIEIVAEHKADTKYPIVSGASIIAKVARDNEIEKIKKIVNYDFNSGYSSDPITINYLKHNYDNEKLSPFIRKKWSTYIRLVNAKNKRQTKLREF